VGSPKGSCIYINGAGGSEVDSARILDCMFENFPSGPFFGRYADDLIVRGCSVLTCQTHVAHASNACFESYQGKRVRYELNHISTFNWKGYEIDNSIGSQMVGCTTVGGVTGQASHYFNGTASAQIIGGSQTGGFGIKCFSCTEVTIKGFQSYDSSGSGIYLQATSHFSITGCTIKQPTNYCVLVESLGGTSSATHGVIEGNFFGYPTAATTTNQVGIRIAADATSVVDSLTISNNVFFQPYWAIHAPSGSGLIHSRIKITGNQIDAPTQYGMLLYLVSGDITHNTIQSAVAFESIYAAGQVGTTGAHLRVNHNTSTNSNGSANHYAVCPTSERCKFDLVEFCDNYGSGGNTLMIASFNANAADYVRLLKVNGNHAYNIAAATAMGITFNTTNVTYTGEFLANALMTSAGALKNIVLTNNAQCTNKLFASTTYNNVNAVTLA
jgi:hypothetical protein